jgi:hypothetical protein
MTKKFRSANENSSCMLKYIKIMFACKDDNITHLVILKNIILTISRFQRVCMDGCR